MRKLSKDEALAILRQLQNPNQPPFLNMAADLEGVPRHLVHAAYTSGATGSGTDLENAFAKNVNRLIGAFKKNALSIITMPGLAKADEPRARQLANVLDKIEKERDAILARPVPKEMGSGPSSVQAEEPVDLEKALSELGAPE